MVSYAICCHCSSNHALCALVQLVETDAAFLPSPTAHVSAWSLRKLGSILLPTKSTVWHIRQPSPPSVRLSVCPNATPKKNSGRCVCISSSCFYLGCMFLTSCTQHVHLHAIHYGNESSGSNGNVCLFCLGKQRWLVSAVNMFSSSCVYVRTWSTVLFINFRCCCLE